MMSSLYNEVRNYLQKKSSKSKQADKCLRVLEYYRTKAMYFQKLHILNEIEQNRQKAQQLRSTSLHHHIPIDFDLEKFTQINLELTEKLKQLEDVA